jgi:hypothetical protein
LEIFDLSILSFCNNTKLNMISPTHARGKQEKQPYISKGGKGGYIYSKLTATLLPNPLKIRERVESCISVRPFSTREMKLFLVPIF